MDKIHNTITYYGRGGCYETESAEIGQERKVKNKGHFIVIYRGLLYLIRNVIIRML